MTESCKEQSELTLLGNHLLYVYLHMNMKNETSESKKWFVPFCTRNSCLFHYVHLGIKFVRLESKLIWFLVSLLEKSSFSFTCKTTSNTMKTSTAWGLLL